MPLGKVVGGRYLVLSSLQKKLLGMGVKVCISHLSRIFSGERNPSVDLLEAMAQALGLSMDEAWDLIKKVRRKEYYVPTIGG